MEKNFKKDRELITALITQKNERIKKSKAFIEETSDKLSKVNEELSEAMLGDDPNKVSSLTVKRDMLSAKLSQSQTDLKKLDTKQNIPEATYKEIMDGLQKKSSEIYWDYQHKLGAIYRELCELIDSTSNVLLEGDGLVRTVNRELYVRTDSMGYEQTDSSTIIGVDGDRIKNALYHGIVGCYGKIS